MKWRGLNKEEGDFHLLRLGRFTRGMDKYDVK